MGMKNLHAYIWWLKLIEHNETQRKKGTDIWESIHLERNGLKRREITWWKLRAEALEQWIGIDENKAKQRGEEEEWENSL